MKIWIDLTNSPHINFFKPFISKWSNEGHHIILTVRDLANTIQLINQNGWEYSVVGGHAGKNKIKKALYFPKRIILLYFFLRGKGVDVGISHSSFYSPGVCRLLKVPSIYLNDNEHANGNYLAFKYATLNLLPRPLMFKAQNLNWLVKYKVEFYPGIKESIYLSQTDWVNPVKLQTKVSKKVYIRLEPWTAEYYKGKAGFMDSFIKKLMNSHEVVLLPRSNEQIKHFEQKEYSRLTICYTPLSLEKILMECNLFIGAGGSMTRELAVLGVPTLSIYQDELLSVDEFLINEGLLFHINEPSVEFVEDFLEKWSACEPHKLLEEGRKAFTFIDKQLKDLVKDYN